MGFLMSSNALDTFDVTQARGKVMAERSVKLAQALLKLPAKPTVPEYNRAEYVADLGRSGIVTAVAAFDRYFTTKFAECVVPVLRHEGPTDGLLKILSNAGLDLKGALGLLHMDRPHRRIRTLISVHLSDFTTQKFHVIDDLFSALGVTKLSQHAQSKAKKKRLKLSIEGLIRRRHVIVHAGDVDSRGKLRPLNPYDAVTRINNLKLLVECADEIINSRMRRCKASKATKNAAAKKGAKKKAVTKNPSKPAKKTQPRVLADVEAVLAAAADGPAGARS